MTQYGQNCDFGASGFISKELINGDPNLASNHFSVTIQIGNNTGSQNIEDIDATVQVSYVGTPDDSILPSESANCKSCPYSQATGFVADPINTNTGVVSYKESDLEIPTSAELLSLQHTYVSSYVIDPPPRWAMAGSITRICA